MKIFRDQKGTMDIEVVMAVSLLVLALFVTYAAFSNLINKDAPQELKIVVENGEVIEYEHSGYGSRDITIEDGKITKYTGNDAKIVMVYEGRIVEQLFLKDKQDNERYQEEFEQDQLYEKYMEQENNHKQRER